MWLSNRPIHEQVWAVRPHRIPTCQGPQIGLIISRCMQAKLQIGLIISRCMQAKLSDRITVVVASIGTTELLYIEAIEFLLTFN